MHLKTTAACLALIALAACETPNGANGAAATSAATPLPFVGAWDCGVATFTFTETTYNNGTGTGGGDTLRIANTETYGADTFGLTMENGYRVGLMDVTARTMTWSSPASGDSFDCRRVS